MIDKTSIEQLKSIIDIYEVISSYIELKKAGMNYIACCPFHDEKTPSFVVSPSRGYYKCYGCGAGGDSISFIMQKEHIDFYEAVEKLAYMYNFTLQYTTQKRDFSINDYLEKIASYFQSRLNKEILQYLEQRGIKSSIIEKFSIGYSGDSNELIDFILKEKMSLESLLEVGIIGKKNNKYYSKFNQRIMFPIFSPSGKVVGFGGRVLSGNIAKYINSQQSRIFNKSQLLYGYNFAKESIFKDKKIIIVEGYIDVIMLHQAGFNNAVATLGTALTQEHLPILSKGDVEILLCYDGDKAGIEAAFRASNMLASRSGGVIIFRDNKDPADMIKEGNIQELLSLLESPIPFIEFVISHIANKYDLKIPLQKQKALNEIKPFYNSLSLVLQDEYKDFVANSLKISPKLLNVESKDIDTSMLMLDKQKIVEDILLKSILEDNNLLEQMLEYLDINAFSNKDAFLAISDGDFENKELIGILLNDNIKPLDVKGFKEQLRIFIINSYKNKINIIKQNNRIDVNDKISIIKKIKKKLDILQKGTLVKLDS